MSGRKSSRIGAAIGFQLVLVGISTRTIAESPTSSIAPIVAELPPADKQVDFAADVLPVLQRNCLACHSASAAEADVVLETPALLRAPREAGSLVTPGEPAASRLVAVAAHLDEPIMPPVDNDVGASPLTPAELGLLQRWIEQGAKDSQTAGSAPIDWQQLPNEHRPILSTAIAPSGDVAACSRGNEVYVYALQPGAQQGQMLATLVDPSLDPNIFGPRGAADVDMVRAVAVDSEADWIATSGYGCVKLWQREHASHEFEAVLPSTKVAAATTSGNHIAVAGEDGTLQLIDLSNSKVIHTWQAHDQNVVGLALVRGGNVLVSAAGDIVKAWQVPNGTMLANWRLSAPPTRFVMPVDDTLVTASDDLVLRVWSLAIPADPPAAGSTIEPAALEPQRTISGHGREIRALAALPGTKQFMSGSVDGTVRQWNAEDGGQVKSWIHGDAVSFVAAQQDGERFVSVGADRKVKIWALSDVNPVATLEGDFRQRRLADRLAQSVQIAQANLKDAQSAVETVKKQLSADEEAKGKALAALDAAKKVAAEKAAALNDVKPKHDTSAKNLAEQNEKRTQAEAALAEATRRNADSEKELELVAAAIKLIQAADEQTTANTALERIRQDRQAYLQTLQRDAQTALEVQTKLRDESQASLDALGQQVNEAQKALDAATSANRDAEMGLARTEESIAGSRMAVQTASDVVTQCSLQLSEQEKLSTVASKQTEDHKPNFQAAAFSPSGSRLLLTDAGGHMYEFDAHSFAPLDSWKSAAPAAALFSLNENDYAIVPGALDGKNRLIRVCSAPAWTLKKSLNNVDGQTLQSDRILSIEFSPDGTLLAAGGGEASRSGQITIWNVADGSLVRSISQPHSDAVFSLAFSPDGQYLASASADRTAKVFRVSDGGLVRTFEGHTDHVTGITWRANGKQLATASADHKIKVWSFELGEQQRTIDAGAKEVTAVNFAGAGGLVVSCSGDRNVRVHNADDGAVVRTIAGAAGYLFCCDTTENGSLVVAGGEDRVLRVWKADDGSELLKLEPRK